MDICKKAEQIFEWGIQERGTDKTSDLWVKHSYAAAKVAKTIAKKANLDYNLAYAMGLLHDIGKYVGHTEVLSTHIVKGYEKMLKENEPEIAKICMTHSFWPKEKVTELDAKNKIGDLNDTQKIKDFINATKYNDYDKLIALADHMSGAHGITTIERRFCSILARHNLKHPQADLIALFELKSHFDNLCKTNIYELFHDEIAESPFRGTPGGYYLSHKDKNI
ncbi:HD domain-containing protein [Candidatus Saccharibacteria bacterium]|nr:HD domain-containing protein [Candidatus Saccharibacteria bacterium]MBR2989546.1 HD domain-containing protein [Candidatus Saccharibacteria bacterium]